MKWDIWNSIKKTFTDNTHNYTLIFYYFIVYLFILLFIYPFIKSSDKVKETLENYVFIIPAILVVLLFYFTSGINKLIGESSPNGTTNFVGSFLLLETIYIFFIMAWKVVMTDEAFFNGVTFDNGMIIYLPWLKIEWPSVTFILALCGFLFTFVGLIWRCTLNNTPTGVVVAGCKNLFHIWWGCVISISVLWIIFFMKTLHNQGNTKWSYYLALFAIIFLFILVVLMDKNKVTTITPNSVLQSLWKYFCMILILFVSSFVLLTKLDYDITTFLSCIAFFLIVINLLPFILQISVTTTQTFLIYPLMYGIPLFIIFGFIFAFTNNVENKLSLSLYGILIAFIFFNIVMLIRNRIKLNEEKEKEEKNEVKSEDKPINLNDKENSKWFWTTFILLTALFSVLISYVDVSTITPRVNLYAKLGILFFTIAFLYICYYLFRISASSIFNFDLAGVNIKDYTLYKAGSYIKEGFGIIFYVLVLYALKQFESPFANLISLLLLLYLFSKFYRPLYDILTAHESKTNCSVSTKGWFGRIISPIVFFICGLLFTFLALWVNGSVILTFTKDSTKTEISKLFGLAELYVGEESPSALIIGIVGALFTLIFTIFGYYVGSSIGDKTNSTENQEDEYCKEFKKVDPLKSTDCIKIIVYFSIIILLFIFMNAYVDKIYKTSWGSFQMVFLGILFFILSRFSITIFNACVHLIQLFSIIFKSNYYSSYTNKLNDFLTFFITIIIIFSNIGLFYKIFHRQKKVTTKKDTVGVYGNNSGIYGNNSGIYGNRYGTTRNYRNLNGNRYKIIGGDINNKISDSIRNNISDSISDSISNIDDDDMMDALFFIPRKINDFYTYCGEYLEKDLFKSIIVIASFETGLIVLYVIISYIKSKLSGTKNAFKLITIPTYLFPATNISSNYFFNPQNETTYAVGIPSVKPYTFGISFSLFIEESGSKNSYINILSYNNNPTIQYKPTSNNLIVTIKQKDKTYNNPESKTVNEDIINSYTILNNHIGATVEKGTIIYSTTDIKLQTWVNIFINYKHGVVDIFIDGELVNSSNGELLIDDYKDGMIVGYGNKGEENDSYIKIDKLNFYDKDIGSDEILYINTF